MAQLKSILIFEDEPDDITLSSIVRSIEVFTASDFMYVDSDSLYALQVIKPANFIPNHATSHKSSIMQLLNKTGSSLGQKMFRSMIVSPLANMEMIKERLSIVSLFLKEENSEYLSELVGLQKTIGNINTTMDHITTGRANFVVWLNLEKFLRMSVDILQIVHTMNQSSGCVFFERILDGIDLSELRSLIKDINFFIDFDASKEWKRVYLRDGINEELDSLKKKYNDLEIVLHDLAYELSKEYQIHDDLLNVVYIPQLGYLVSVDVDLEFEFPEAWDEVFRTATNIYFKDQYMNQMDTEYGDVYQLIIDFEIELLYELQTKILEYSVVLHGLGACFAELDCYLALATSAILYGFCEPEMVEEPVLLIERGRHPLYEQQVGSYIPNDTQIDDSNTTVITGANGSGKSVYLTQVGLIVYLAHIGSFVPASAARIGLCDRLLTRIITRESIEKTSSTFFTDLQRMSKCVQMKTERSVLLIDEFGKGTDTIGGPALLGSIIQSLAESSLSSRSILTTHFHELFKPGILPSDVKLRHNHMKVLFSLNADTPNDVEKITYLYQLQDGLCDNSFGIECASFCGIPTEIIKRAKQISSEDDHDEKLSADIKLNKAKRITKDFLMWNVEECDPDISDTALRDKLREIIQS
ncbi:hypothetical protein WICPIJ_002087 [Wickerhamomyces pijperi]|uniref:DNA mismatch repair proteins mutS family domain-containing protein n=1 Tax=Wickerhamomyces pijperi TaxID=599730 RepID=A0A9P8TPZ1_WICPI|nr:hypothetical protein WICPIJ_002087 [Wickerhamomyces pijperi]